MGIIDIIAGFALQKKEVQTKLFTVEEETKLVLKPGVTSEGYPTDAQKFDVSIMVDRDQYKGLSALVDTIPHVRSYTFPGGITLEAWSWMPENVIQWLEFCRSDGRIKDFKIKMRNEYPQKS